MKKVISMALCLILVMTMALSVSAATIVNETNHDYQAYQIFSGTQNNTEAMLASVEWGSGVDGAALLADLQSLPTFAGAANADAVSTILGRPTTSNDAINQFAQLAYNNKTDVYTEIPAGATEVALATGYYLIVDATTPVEGDAKNPALLQVTNAGPIQISKKYDVPESEKSVIANDTGDHSAHASDEDSPVGQKVEFHLKGVMPLNMRGYEQYTMVFHDDLSEGLTFVPDSVQVFVGDENTPVTTGYTLVYPVDDCDKDGDNYTCDFHVEIEDVMAYRNYSAGCEVIIKYEAILNENALINEGNPNDFRLEYSNDPNWDPDDPDATPTSPTGVTPWKEVEVWTTEVEIRKVDGNTDLPLQGAEFTLTGTSDQKVKVTKNVFTAYADDATVDPDNKYWKLVDGTYTTMDPATPEIDQDAYESITQLYYQSGVDTSWETTSTELSVAATVGTDGTVKFGGLGEGVYTITETVAPGGYNGLKEPMTLTIVFHEAEERFEYSWTGGATGTGYSIQVDNMSGSVLPETGGIGTTLFYVIGGLLFAASAVLLVTKKRMSEV